MTESRLRHLPSSRGTVGCQIHFEILVGYFLVTCIEPTEKVDVIPSRVAADDSWPYNLTEVGWLFRVMLFAASLLILHDNSPVDLHSVPHQLLLVPYVGERRIVVRRPKHVEFL